MTGAEKIALGLAALGFALVVRELIWQLHLRRICRGQEDRMVDVIIHEGPDAARRIEARYEQAREVEQARTEKAHEVAFHLNDKRGSAMACLVINDAGDYMIIGRN